MPNQGHILSTFDETLRQLRETTITMGAGTQRNIQNAVRGLLERNKELCNTAIADDDDEDRLEVEIDRLGMSIITKFRPLASDLRLVIASMKIASHLERISDQAVSVAKRSRKLIKNAEIPETRNIEGLYNVSASMLADAMTAYTDTDTQLALQVIEREKELKKCHKSTTRHFSSSLEGESEQYRDYLDLVFICRWLERVGDLATNIAEDVIFEETSTDIRHGGELPAELQD
ncbi:phosphate signaling complex protein PhoU [Verrucomicrobiaceae bacterium R5-34]|uniref:Phosphate-specific transport system accessory protein PhoU n=1 Tax=Oceaniferula flava TaxID=2800421 RepID=A0AAE2V7D9_9BACT|nr:phosphate signaling complex protein PhoU [Oceaniferula flavus]MBK1829345.1 phosphate signaling complex protein PhoU [Verrucomicrobiaceae bacterium R5-34]MBK1853572.1 phosphate signaling complex protein PhoU [Oceaniferula flavus]MBM1134877.1 phosphate signaling complex protein PhoU [Oceaniferula flavus]